MPLDQQEATKLSVKDLSSRLSVSESDIVVESTESTEFPNACLGAARPGELCAEMMLKGWRLKLKSQKQADKVYEYRAAKNQIRLFDFNGQNFKIYP